jgi:hypothetical protein
MKSQLQVTLLLTATLVLPLVAAQQQTPAPPAQPAPKTQLPKSQLPDLNRQTQATDKVPVFNFDAYFTGKWNFTWDVPEGPLGPAGTITGTTVFKPVETPEGKFFLATSEGTGPAGPVKFTELYGYQADKNSLSRYTTDARGYQFLSVGTVGGDLGGYFNIYLEGAPFTVNGKSVRMKSAVRLLSPLNYKVQTTISVDGGPFTNYGNPWWRKDAPGVTNPQ